MTGAARLGALVALLWLTNRRVGPMGVGGESADPLADWMRSLRMPVKSGTIDTFFGDWNIEGGECSGLSVGDLEAVNVGTPTEPEVEYRLAGLSLLCRIISEQGTLVVDVGVAVNAFVLTLAFHKRLGAPGMSLQLGKVTVSKCTLKVELTSMEFSGTSSYVPNLEENRGAAAELFSQLVSRYACTNIAPRIQAFATEACFLLAKLLDPLEEGKSGKFLSPDLSLRQVADALLGTLGFPPGTATLPETRWSPQREEGRAAALPQTTSLADGQLDWGAYPPFLLGQSLVAERSSAVGHAAMFFRHLDVPVGLKLSNPIGREAVGLHVDSVALEGMDTLSSESVALQGSGSSMTVSAKLRDLTLKAVARVQLEQTQNWGALDLPLSLTVELQDMIVSLGISASLVEHCMNRLRVDQLQNVGCIAGCAEGNDAWTRGASFGLRSLAVDAVPRLRLAAFSMDSLAGLIASTLDVTVLALLREHDDASRRLVRSGSELIVPAMNTALQNRMGSVVGTCGSSRVFMGPTRLTSNLLLSGSAVALVAGVVQVVVACLIIPGSSENNGCDPRPASQSKRYLQATLPETPASSSILRNPAVPVAIAHGFPALTGAAAFLFAYSAVGIGTAVNLIFHSYSNGETTTIDNAFTFSLATSIIDSWKGGAYAISLATLLLSGIWPFIKLALMCFCWVAPHGLLGIKARGQYLRFLDNYGKYSLLDTFLAMFAFAAYRMEWHSTDASVTVEPSAQPPFFVFIIATVISLVLGHVAVEYHHKSIAPDAALSPSAHVQSKTMQLCLLDPDSHRSGFLTISLVLTGFLLVCAVVVPTFRIRTFGVMPALIVDPAALDHMYSFVLFAQDILAGLQRPPLVLLALQAVLVVFAFVIPLLLVIGLLLVWHLPLSSEMHTFGIFVCKVLNAWASFDVFVLAVIIATLELWRFAEFLVYDDNVAAMCNWVRSNLETECLAMSFELTGGFAVMFAAGVAISIVPKVALAACKQALHNRGHEGLSSSTWEEEEASSSEEDSVSVEASELDPRALWPF